jgi:alkylation response protein AidB-like acyl-CoA dehydrogenase
MSDRPALTTLTEEELEFQNAFGDFFREAVKPKVHEMDQAQQMDKGLVRQFFEMGMMGIEIPEEFGGTGLNFFTSILLIEEAAKVDPAVSVLIDVQNTLVINALRKWASDDIKKRIFPKLAQESVGAYCLSESSSGSDAFALRCKATKDGDDYLLSGNKLWITNGNEADVFLVFATTDYDLGYRGITCFLVERGQEGFTVGKKEDKLGIRASSTCELIFENVRVTPDNIVGPVGKGYKVAIETLNEGRIGIGAQMVGLAQGALDATVEYVQGREQFGKPIASFQAVQHQIAQMATDVEAARLMVYNAARLKDADLPFLKEAAMAKLFSSQVAERVASKCVELHGGNGFTTEYPVEKFFRDSKIGSIYEGTSNMQLSTIAKMIIR